MTSSTLRLKPLQTVAPSNRLARTERPYIEDVLDAYRDLENLTVLALGSSSWNPPEKALSKAEKEIFNREIHRYGEILGYPPLQTELRRLLRQQAIKMDKMDIAITAGANQAFLNVATLLTDAQDDVVVVAPYYFSHVMALQLCDTKVHVCPFDSKTLQPDWPTLKTMIEAHQPKMVCSSNVPISLQSLAHLHSVIVV
jgi:aspartate/methionine/tyrosine aminotransferase